MFCSIRWITSSAKGTGTGPAPGSHVAGSVSARRQRSCIARKAQREATDSAARSGIGAAREPVVGVHDRPRGDGAAAGVDVVPEVASAGSVAASSRRRERNCIAVAEAVERIV